MTTEADGNDAPRRNMAGRTKAVWYYDPGDLGITKPNEIKHVNINGGR